MHCACNSVEVVLTYFFHECVRCKETVKRRSTYSGAVELAIVCEKLNLV